ncbi:MAG: hypothetical protein N2053_12980, partial [Chitinispirillaceae bacterium]|nr:hypothetical protein [Chitinispirillaceae bacterium]
DTLLQVIGTRSFDGVCDPGDDNWAYISNKCNQSATGTSGWNFTPTDTGSGIIVVSRTGAVSDTITVKVNPGSPAKLEHYAKEGPVPNVTNPPYPDPTTEITAIAGTPFPLVAKIFDRRNVWLPAYEQRSDMSRLIKWRIIELPGPDASGFLDDTSGHKRNFTPVRAYQSVYVVAYMEIGGGSIIADTVKLKIEPGKPKRLVLEGSSTYDPLRPHPIDTVRIPFNATSARVYAILRDSIGNFVSYSTVTQWGVVNNDTSVSVRNGNTTVGEGVITRNVAEARVKVFGVDVGLDLETVHL